MFDGDERFAGDRSLYQQRRSLSGLVTFLVRRNINRVRVSIIPRQRTGTGDFEGDRSLNLMSTRVAPDRFEQIFSRFTRGNLFKRNRNRLDAEDAAGSQDPERDLPAVCDQDLAPAWS